MRRLTLATAGIMTLLAAVACGGDGGGPASDEAQIHQLTGDTFNYLQQERWSNIYDLYSQEFQDRCRRDEFIGQFVELKALLGEKEFKDLFKEMKLVAAENIQIQGDTATAEVTSKFWGEERTGTAYYVRENGKWRIAPQPGTQGCETSTEWEYRMEPTRP